MTDTDGCNYLEEFMRDYQWYGKFNLEKQIPHLAKLADDYKSRYKQNRNWTDCLKVS